MNNQIRIFEKDLAKLAILLYIPQTKSASLVCKFDAPKYSPQSLWFNTLFGALQDPMTPLISKKSFVQYVFVKDIPSLINDHTLSKHAF